MFRTYLPIYGQGIDARQFCYKQFDFKNEINYNIFSILQNVVGRNVVL
jgi:hypothetical protein